MTAEQLIKKLNDTYGLDQWLPKMELDAETYASVCQFVFNRYWDAAEYWDTRGIRVCDVALGPTKGIMFKNVEMILWKG